MSEERKMMEIPEPLYDGCKAIFEGGVYDAIATTWHENGMYEPLLRKEWSYMLKKDGAIQRVGTPESELQPAPQEPGETKRYWRDADGAVHLMANPTLGSYIEEVIPVSIAEHKRLLAIAKAAKEYIRMGQSCGGDAWRHLRALVEGGGTE